MRGQAYSAAQASARVCLSARPAPPLRAALASELGIGGHVSHRLREGLRLR